MIDIKPIGYRYKSRKEAKEVYSKYRTVEGYWLHYLPDEEIDKRIKEISTKHDKIYEMASMMCYIILEELDAKKSIKNKVEEWESKIYELSVEINFTMDSFRKSGVTITSGKK